MSQRSSDVKVGIAVIVAAVILIAGVVWIGDFRVNRELASYTVYFSEVGGLGSGDPVTVAGLEMGEVGPMVFEGGRVRTELLLKENVNLRTDCSVEIRSVGLMGEKFVYIFPGTAGNVISPGATIEGKYKAGLTEMTILMEDVFAEVRSLSQSIRKLTDSGGENPSLGETLARLNTLADELVALIRENKEDLRGTAKSVREASDNISDILGTRKKEITDGIDRLARASARLDSLSLSLRSLAVSLEKGEGTLGALVTDRTLYEDIRGTVDDLDALIKDIKEHPERYIKVEIF